MSGNYFNVHVGADQRRQPVPLPFSVIESIVNSLPQIPSVDQEAGKLARQYHMLKTRDALLKILMIPDPACYERLKDSIVSKYRQSLIVDDQRIGMFAAETLSNGAYQVTMDSFGMGGQDLMLGEAGLRNIEALYNVQLDRNDPKVLVHFDPAYGRMPSYHFTKNDVVDMRAQLVQMTVQDFIMPDGIEIAPFEAFEGDNVSDDLRRLRSSVMEEMSMNAQQVGWWDRLFILSNPNGHIVSTSISVMRVRFDVTIMYAHRVTLQMIAETISRYGKIAAEDLVMIQSSFDEGVIDFLTGEDFRVLKEASGSEGTTGTSREISELLFFNGILVPHFKNLKVKGVTGLTELNPVEVNVVSAIKRSERAVMHRVSRHGFEMMKKALKFEADHRTFIDNIFDVNEIDFASEYRAQNNPNVVEILTQNGRTVFYSADESFSHPKVRLLPQEVINLELAEFYNPGDAYSDATAERFSRTWVLTLDQMTIKIKGVTIRVIRDILKLANVKILHEINDELLVTHVGEIYVESAEDPIRLIEAYLNSAYNVSNIFKVVDDEITLSRQHPIISSATIKSILLTSDLTLDHPVPGTVAEITDKLRSAVSRNESYDHTDLFTVTTLRDHKSVQLKGKIMPVPTSYFHEVMKNIIELVSNVNNNDLVNLRSQIILSATTMSHQRIHNFLKVLLSVLQIKENLPSSADDQLQNYDLLEAILGTRYGSFFKNNSAAVQIVVNDYRENISQEAIEGILTRADFRLGKNSGFTQDEIILKLREHLTDPHAKIYRKYVYAVATVMHPALAKKQLFRDKIKTSVYKSLLMYPWVDRSKTISNDLREIQRALGVETSRNYFIYELTQTLAAFKVTPNIRHVLIAADFIYRMGHPVGLSRSGISQHRIGFVSEVIVGNSAQQLSKSYQRDPESVAHIGPATVLGAISLVKSRHPELIAESRKRAMRDELSKANKLRYAQERNNKRNLSFEFEGNLRYYVDDAPTLDFLPNGEIEEVNAPNKLLAVDIKDDDTDADEYLHSVEIAASFYNEVDAKIQQSIPVVNIEDHPNISPVTWKSAEYSGLSFDSFLDQLFTVHMESAKAESNLSKDRADALEKSIQSSNHSYGFGDLDCLEDTSGFVDVIEMQDIIEMYDIMS